MHTHTSVHDTYTVVPAFCGPSDQRHPAICGHVDHVRTVFHLIWPLMSGHLHNADTDTDSTTICPHNYGQLAIFSDIFQRNLRRNNCQEEKRKIHAARSVSSVSSFFHLQANARFYETWNYQPIRIVITMKSRDI